MTVTDVWDLDSARQPLRDSFLRWQCRIRQLAIRNAAGRPSSGMIPNAITLDGTITIARFVTVLCRRPEHSTTMEFRHLVRQTHDPAIRRTDALKFFAASYYQFALQFSDTITASFAADSAIAAALIKKQRCRLCFEQFSQGFNLNCNIRALPAKHPLHEATFWHNLLFNPHLPTDCVILGLAPDWSCSNATVLHPEKPQPDGGEKGEGDGHQ